MINIYIDETFLDLVNSAELEKAAIAVLQSYSNIPEGELTIAIENDEHLRELNNKYLKIDEPTDVLSFPSGEDDVDHETGRFYLGDIIISYPRASEQAEDNGHPVLSELIMLVIHGALHLLGYDHAELEGKKLMWSAQQEILLRLGVQLKRFPD